MHIHYICTQIFIPYVHICDSRRSSHALDSRKICVQIKFVFDWLKTTDSYNKWNSNGRRSWIIDECGI